MKYEGVTEVEWAQLATWFDSDGFILISKERPQPSTGRRTTLYRPIVGVSNTNPLLMDWLEERFGGRTTVERPQSDKHKESLHWLAHMGLRGDKLISLLESVLPYLLLKRRQAELAIEFYQGAVWKNGGSPGERQTPPQELARREELHQAVKALNRNGPDGHN